MRLKLSIHQFRVHSLTIDWKRKNRKENANWTRTLRFNFILFKESIQTISSTWIWNYSSTENENTL